MCSEWDDSVPDFVILNTMAGSGGKVNPIKHDGTLLSNQQRPLTLRLRLSGSGPGGVSPATLKRRKVL